MKRSKHIRPLRTGQSKLLVRRPISSAIFALATALVVAHDDVHAGASQREPEPEVSVRQRYGVSPAMGKPEVLGATRRAPPSGWPRLDERERIGHLGDMARRANETPAGRLAPQMPYGGRDRLTPSRDVIGQANEARGASNQTQEAHNTMRESGLWNPAWDAGRGPGSLLGGQLGSGSPSTWQRGASAQQASSGPADPKAPEGLGGGMPRNHVGFSQVGPGGFPSRLSMAGEDSRKEPAARMDEEPAAERAQEARHLGHDMPLDEGGGSGGGGLYGMQCNPLTGICTGGPRSPNQVNPAREGQSQPGPRLVIPPEMLVVNPGTEEPRGRGEPRDIRRGRDGVTQVNPGPAKRPG